MSQMEDKKNTFHFLLHVIAYLLNGQNPEVIFQQLDGQRRKSEIVAFEAEFCDLARPLVRKSQNAARRRCFQRG